MNKTVLIIGIIVVIAIIIFKFGFTSPKQDLEKRIDLVTRPNPQNLLTMIKLLLSKT